MLFASSCTSFSTSGLPGVLNINLQSTDKFHVYEIIINSVTKQSLSSAFHPLCDSKMIISSGRLLSNQFTIMNGNVGVDNISLHAMHPHMPIDRLLAWSKG